MTNRSDAEDCFGPNVKRFFDRSRRTEAMVADEKMENKDPVAGFANLRINGQVLTLSLWIKGLVFLFRAADC